MAVTIQAQTHKLDTTTSPQDMQYKPCIKLCRLQLCRLHLQAQEHLPGTPHPIPHTNKSVIPPPTTPRQHPQSTRCLCLLNPTYEHSITHKHLPCDTDLRHTLPEGPPLPPTPCCDCNSKRWSNVCLRCGSTTQGSAFAHTPPHGTSCWWVHPCAMTQAHGKTRMQGQHHHTQGPAQRALQWQLSQLLARTHQPGSQSHCADIERETKRVQMQCTLQTGTVSEHGRAPNPKQRSCFFSSGTGSRLHAPPEPGLLAVLILLLLTSPFVPARGPA